MKPAASDQPALLVPWGARLLCLPFALVILVSIAEAQTARNLDEENQEQLPEDSSQQVDESDESYRQRMELRDGFPNQQTRIETTYSTPASNAKIDQLPASSQKHIKDQLREMIITEGQWEPGDDLSDYPYEPSTAAQTDSQLRGKEREAFLEELQKYQEREAAAYAQATGQEMNEGKAGQQGQPGAENGAKQGEKGQQGSSGSDSSQDSATAAAERKARAEQAAAAYQGQSRSTDEAVSTAGVSESALSYLQAMKGGSESAPPGGSAQQPGGQEGEQQASSQQSAQEGSQDAGENAAQQAGQMASQMADAESKTESGESTEESAEQEAQAENLAGTIAVGDLQNLFAQSGENPGTPASEQSITYQSTQPLVVIEPGTLTIEELRMLDESESE